MCLLHPQTNNEGEDGGLPVKVGAYHTLSPLEPITAEGDQQSSALGLRTLLIKGVSAFDGQAYALRRIDCQQVGGAESVGVSAHTHARAPTVCGVSPCCPEADAGVVGSTHTLGCETPKFSRQRPSRSMHLNKGE